MPTVNIPEYYRPALDKIAAMTPEQVDNLRNALTRTAVSLKPPTLTAKVLAQVPDPAPAFDEIVETLVALSTARGSTDVSIEDFARDVAKFVARRKERPKDYDQAVFEKTLGSLLAVEALSLSARAAEIQHDYEKVFASARIVSDIRTVFGSPNVEPVGAMIVHNLKVTYFEQGGIKEAFFALDNADLANLRKLIDRAELKTTQLEQVIKSANLRYFESK